MSRAVKSAYECLNSVFNVKVLVGAFNPVIVKTDCVTDGSSAALVISLITASAGCFEYFLLLLLFTLSST